MHEVRDAGTKIHADVTAFTKMYFRETFAIDYLKGCDGDYWAKECQACKKTNCYISHYHLFSLSSDGVISKTDFIVDELKVAQCSPC